MTSGNNVEVIFKVAFSLLMISLMEKGVCGQCSFGSTNQAVYEGTQNMTIMCSNPTLLGLNVSWSVYPTNNEQNSFNITYLSDTVTPSLTGIYDVVSNDLHDHYLIVKTAQTTPAIPPIATSGLYVARYGESGLTMIGAKLVVVRQGPTCNCTAINSTDNELTCSVTYGDGSVYPINVNMTWTSDGSFYTNDTPARTMVNNVIVSTSTITVNGNDPAIYQCNLTFAKPIENWSGSYIATNAPEFSAACTSTCHYSNGSLTRKPTNIAAFAGSSNITLECASSYGTDATRWTFTPLGSFSNETIQISNGYQLLDTRQLKYVLHATTNSSVLIVLQLSNLTEGTYSCHDDLESASALLLMIPFRISMEPLFGPVAGGTNITIIGSSAINYLSKYVGSNITGVRNVYIGKDLSSTSVSLLTNGSSTFAVVAVTPNTTEESVGKLLPMITEFLPTPFNMTFNKAFTYLPNPEITALYPKQFVVIGGTLLDVTGQSLSSVAKPIIQLTVVITRATENNSTSNTSTTSATKVCTVPQGNDTYMQCPMPPLNLPDDFIEILNSLYNTSTIRRKRDIKPSDTNVLTVVGPKFNGVDRADIYLGFILDGYKEYENINDALPDTKFIFYSAPEINSSNEVIEFDPTEDELIYVKGRYMLRGCRLRDYLVHIGNQICTNSDLQDNQLSCRPPKEKPSSTMNETNYCGQHLSITITLGYKQYQYACLTYTDRSATFALIVGLTVGLSEFALFLTILIVCILSCRRKKESQDTDRRQNSGTQEFGNPNYDTHFGNDVYPKSLENYAQRRQGYDDNISANDEYLNYFDDFDRKSQNPVPSTVFSDESFNLSSNAVYENSRESKFRALK